MPKKRPADERAGGRASKIPSRRRKHLYLVVDDWERGYSIRKLDLSSDSDSDDVDEANGPDGRTGTELRLPPAVFRLEAPRARSGLFAAFGTKIVATQLTPRGTIPMFDVRTRAFTFGPRQEGQPNPCCTDFVQVGDNLYFIDDSCFMMLDPPPPPPKFAHPYIQIDWTWRGLPVPPFDDCPVSYAVHPDGRTIFFSTQGQTKKHTEVATFTFDTVCSQWTRHGAWRLPFRGRGYFDCELNAWVGLSGQPDNLGHLCTCEVVSADANTTDGHPPPTCKLSKEKLFCVDPAEKHIGATLVYIGGRSKFCLVQCIATDDRKGGVWEEVLPECLCYLYRVTTFSLNAVHHRLRSYRLPKIATEYCDHLEKPVAFWM
uniref:DUF1618 domain-containing protein n=1 Tax=Setaria italica TaxID=4555 RepID=K3YXQ5_SETIT